MSEPEPGAWLQQGERGYRYNQDSFLLADFFRSPAGGMVADFCAGSGVVSLLIGSENPSLKIIALEINQEMAGIAARNARARGFNGYHVLAGDVMQAPSLFKGRPFSAIVSNPPYRKFGRGKLNPDPAKALARHELRMTMQGLVEAASLLLKPGGLLSIIMIMERLEEYGRLLRASGFCESRRREIRHYRHSPPKLFLSEAVYSAEARLETEPPFILAEESGWTPEYNGIMDKYAR